MAASLRGIGAAANGTTGFTAAVPTGGSAPVAGDAMYIVMESADATNQAGTPDTPTNWTKLFEDTQAPATNGLTTLTIFGKIAGAGETDVSVTGVGDHCSGRLLAVGNHGLSSIAGTVVGTASKADSASVTGLAITVVANSFILLCSSTSRDASSTTTFTDVGGGGGWTNASLTSLTEIADNTTTTGTGGGIGICSGLCAGTDSGAWTVTKADSTSFVSVSLGIPPRALSTLALLGVG